MSEIALAVMIFNIFLLLNTSFFSKGIVISNRTKILSKYMKYEFIIDLISLTPIILMYLEAIKARNLVLMVFFLKTSNF